MNFLGEITSPQVGSHNDPTGFREGTDEDLIQGELVIRSMISGPFLALMMLMGGCASPPWADEPAQPPPSEAPSGTVQVPPEDREQVEELIRARAEERERLAEANRRRESALHELTQARSAMRQWQERPQDPERDEMIRAWQVRITELEEEVRKQNTALGRDREDGLSPPSPPRPPVPPTPPTPQ